MSCTIENMLDQSSCGCFLGSRLAKSDDDKVKMQCDFSMWQNPFHTSRIKILTPKIIHTLYQKCWHKGEYILAHPSCSEPSHPGNWGSRAAFLPRSTPPLWIHHSKASNVIIFQYRSIISLAPKALLDFLRPMITINPTHPHIVVKTTSPLKI